MNTTAKAHEPTMEEILASIRRIISDDEPGAAPAPAAASAPKKPALEPTPSAALGQDDIDAMLASFDAPEIESNVTPMTAKPAATKASEPPLRAHRPLDADDLDVLELTDAMAADAPPAQPPAVEPIQAMERPQPAAPAFAPPAEIDRLLSSAADEAVGASFGTLAHTFLSNNGRSIDDVVKEMLRPMLRNWLDDNLPPLVERLVRAEIERVARGGR